MTHCRFVILSLVLLAMLSIPASAFQIPDEVSALERAGFLDIPEKEQVLALLAELPEPLVVTGSNLDYLEEKGFNLLKAYIDVPVISDSETSYNGKSLSEYNLILIGGPKSNAIAAKYAPKFEYERTDSKPRLVILKAGDGSSVMASSIYSFPFAPKKDVPADNFIPPEVVPAAAAATSIFFLFFSKILIALLKFLKIAAGEYFESFLALRTMKHKIRTFKKFFLGLSKIELLNLFAAFIIFGVATAYAYSLNLSNFKAILFPYLLAAGFTFILHEAAHNYVAHKFKVESEFRIWGFGVLAVAVTAYFFGSVFAIPGVTVLYGEASKQKRGIIHFAGPLVSLALVGAFYFLQKISGFLGTVGTAGLSIALTFAVFEMLPLIPMDGGEVKNWKKLLWAAYFIPLAAAYVWMFLL